MKKIAFIKIGNFSYTNDSVREILVNNFPRCQLLEIDITRDILQPKSLINLIHSVLQYGPRVMHSKNNLRTALAKNTYFFKKIRKSVCDILKNEDVLFTFQTQSLFDASIPGVPHFLYTDHTFLENEKYPGFDKSQVLYNKHWMELEKSIYHNATINFTMSSNISASIIQDYGCSEGKVACVYAGANFSHQSMEIPPKKSRDSKNILFVGVDWERKGGPTLLKAFEFVLDKHPDASLTIVGCSPKVEMNNCNVVGKIPLSDVGRYYEEADIFCLPTTLEPFGIVFLEAMSYRLPIVASDIGAIPDFVVEGKNGYKVPVGDYMMLAEKLTYLLETPEKRNAFGRFGNDDILPRYTWENVGALMQKHIVANLS